MWEISHLLLPASPFLPPPCQSWLPCCPWLAGWWSDLRLTFDDASQRLQVAMSRAWKKNSWMGKSYTHISHIIPSVCLAFSLIKLFSPRWNYQRFIFQLFPEWMEKWRCFILFQYHFWSNPYLEKCITYLKRPLGSLASFVSSMLSPRKYNWHLS